VDLPVHVACFLFHAHFSTYASCFVRNYESVSWNYTVRDHHCSDLAKSRLDRALVGAPWQRRLKPARCTQVVALYKSRWYFACLSSASTSSRVRQTPHSRLLLELIVHDIPIVTIWIASPSRHLTAPHSPVRLQGVLGRVMGARINFTRCFSDPRAADTPERLLVAGGSDLTQTQEV